MIGSYPDNLDDGWEHQDKEHAPKQETPPMFNSPQSRSIDLILGSCLGSFIVGGAIAVGFSDEINSVLTPPPPPDGPNAVIVSVHDAPLKNGEPVDWGVNWTVHSKNHTIISLDNGELWAIYGSTWGEPGDLVTVPHLKSNRAWTLRLGDTP